MVDEGKRSYIMGVCSTNVLGGTSAMLRQRYIPKTCSDRPVTAFESAEAAWFWFVRCQQVRREGARIESAAGTTARPCDPDDIYRAADRLLRSGASPPAHVRTLGHYGLLQKTPDPRCDEEANDAKFWEEAIDRLCTPLRNKGIVE